MPTLGLYPAIVFDNPPTEFSSEVDEACEQINEATKGWGTDESGLIDALSNKTVEMRFLINERYPGMFGKDLHSVIKKECRMGDFGMAMQFLALDPVEAECQMLYQAMKGLGTKERLIYPILAGRSNEDIVKLKETYFKMFSKDLGVKLALELSGNLQKLIFQCIQGAEKEYDADFFTIAKAEADADAFEAAGNGQWGTDEKSLFSIVAKSPPEHLAKVNDIYTAKNEVTLIAALGSELKGDVEKAAQYAVGMKLKPYATVAKHIKGTCAGAGTDEIALTCDIIRYTGIMKEVNLAHADLYGKTIQERIDSEVGGKYKELLTKIVDAACA